MLRQSTHMPAAPVLVLVADDEPAMVELVARHLRNLTSPRFETVVASDGEAAWRLACKHLPDLVILDVMMPGMSGWEVCRKIREDAAFAHTSVVMLTGIGQNLNEMTSPLYGADAYLDKPFDFEELDEKVKHALDVRAAQRDAVARNQTSNTTSGAQRAGGNHTMAMTKKMTTKKSTKSKPMAAKKSPSARKSAPAAKKTTAKKPAAKKPAAKRKATTAKKPAAKRKATTAKKPAAKKPAAKHKKATPAKKAPAKRAHAKKPAAKKPAFKRS